MFRSLITSVTVSAMQVVHVAASRMPTRWVKTSRCAYRFVHCGTIYVRKDNDPRLAFEPLYPERLIYKRKSIRKRPDVMART